MKNNIIKKIEEIIGKKNVLLSSEDKSKYLIEWRNRYPGKAQAILRPKSTKEVSLLLKLFNKNNISVTPQGGNTGLVGGQITYSSKDFIVSLERMKKLISFNKIDETMVVQSGMLLSEIHAICEENDMLFPLSLASEGSCTIGGNLATNAGGVGVLYYGNTRELTLGLEVVLSDGSIINLLKTLKKDNTGYSLKDLFIGSEGTLGIITAASLKIFQKPKEKFTFLASSRSPKKSLEFLRMIQKNTSIPLTSFEIMNNNSIKTVLKNIDGAILPISEEAEWYILIEFSSYEKKLDAIDKINEIVNLGLEKKIISNAVFANSKKQSKQIWDLRENISEAQRKDGASIKNDISVPIFAVDEFIKKADSIVSKAIPKAKKITFGHLGDGNIHYNISQPENLSQDSFFKLERPLREKLLSLIVNMDGSFSAEHGIGIVRKKDALKIKGDEIKIMKSIKKSLDPKNILNPGKIFD